MRYVGYFWDGPWDGNTTTLFDASPTIDVALPTDMRSALACSEIEPPTHLLPYRIGRYHRAGKPYGHYPDLECWDYFWDAR